MDFLQGQNPLSWLQNPLALGYRTQLSLHVDYLFLNIAWSCLKNLPYEQLISTQHKQFPGKIYSNLKSLTHKNIIIIPGYTDYGTEYHSFFILLLFIYTNNSQNRILATAFLCFIFFFWGGGRVGEWVSYFSYFWNHFQLLLSLYFIMLDFNLYASKFYHEVRKYHELLFWKYRLRQCFILQAKHCFGKKKRFNFCSAPAYF